MGFFRRLFGSSRAPPAPPFVPPAYPFSGEDRLRHSEYDVLSTGWWRVSVNSPAEWEGKLLEMREGLRRHFGVYLTKDGRTVPRWNDRTWTSVQTGLVVEGR